MGPGEVSPPMSRKGQRVGERRMDKEDASGS